MGKIRESDLKMLQGAHAKVLDIISACYDVDDALHATMKSLRERDVKEVIYSGNATIVKFSEGGKSITKCQDGDVYDREKGILYALVKAAYPDWHEIMQEWCWNG